MLRQFDGKTSKFKILKNKTMKKIIILIGLLLTSAIQAQETDFCAKVKTETDKITGEVRTFTEMARGNSVMKVVSKGKTKYYLRLNILNSSAVANPKGAIALLANGDVIERTNAPVTFDANSGGNKFRYNSVIELTASELKLLKEFPIILIHLHTFDSDELKLDKLMEQVKCLDL